MTQENFERAIQATKLHDERPRSIFGVTLEQKIRMIGWDEVAGPLETPCWEWRGARNAQGYGKTTRPVTTKHVSAHRASYECFKGEIPEGLVVMHSCDNPPCVNPIHLSLGTTLDNVRDMKRKGRSVRLSGDDCPNSKLTSSQVSEIRELRTSGLLMREIAERYGVNRSTIGYILRGDTWKGV